MNNLGIVINNKARNAGALTAFLEAFKAHNIDYELYKTEPNELEGVLKQAKLNHSILLVGGGDGTVRSAAQECVGSSCVLGILPLGTLNHFVQELSLPSTPEDLAQAVINKASTLIDVAQVNGYIFVNNSSIGFYPHFARRRNYYSKFYNKWLSYIPGFWQALQYHPSFNLLLENESSSFPLRTSFLMVSNNLYTYEFPLKYAREDFNQAQLGVYYFKYGTLRLTKIFGYFFKRKKSFAIKSTQTPFKITVEEVDTINVALDGEVIKLDSPLNYRSLPNSLMVLKRL